MNTHKLDLNLRAEIFLRISAFFISVERLVVTAIGGEFKSNIFRWEKEIRLRQMLREKEKYEWSGSLGTPPCVAIKN